MSMTITVAAEEVTVKPGYVGPFKVTIETEPEQLGKVLEEASDWDLQTILEGVNEKRIKKLLNLQDA